jgi:transposase
MTEYAAIDLHTRRSQIRIVDEDGVVLIDRRIDTTRAAFTAVFGGRKPMRILIEASTKTEWVAQCLEAVGHEIVVGDPNYTLMYGARARRIKTDKRDVAALAEACRLGIFRPAHRVSSTSWRERQRQRVRSQVVRQRTALINLTRALLRQEGYRLPGGDAETVVARVDTLHLSPSLREVLEPLRGLLAPLVTTIRTLDRAAAARAASIPAVTRLMTAPGVGPIVALNFYAVLDDPKRFGGDARRAAAFVGLVPREASSAERRWKGRITKTGPPILRMLLIQASWAVWRSRRRDTVALRAWAEALAARRGRRIAIVALARRLCRMLYAMWRDGAAFRPGGAVVSAA